MHGTSRAECRSRIVPTCGPPLLYDGPNASLVNPVIAFAFGEQVLSSVGPDEVRDDLVIITDLRRAIEFAAGYDDEAQIAIEPAVMRRLANMDDLGEGCSLGWLNLREHMAAEHLGYDRRPGRNNRLKSALEKMKPLFMAYHEPYIPFEDHLDRLLPAPPHGPRGDDRDDILNEVRHDLMNCAENRTINGDTSNFWESLLRVYMEGLWPCGWQGVWPTSGKYIAWRRRK